MIPETDEERIEREAYEKQCEHEYGTVEMPYDWERMSGVMLCTKCTYGVSINIERVKS